MSATSAYAVSLEIEAAFGALPYPGDANLTSFAERDAPFPDELAEAFRGKRWQAIEAATVCKFCDELPELTPLAFRYYLPAYMTRCLLSPDDVNPACMSTIVMLTPASRKNERSWRWWWERVELFDLRQCRAIVYDLAYQDAFDREQWASVGRPKVETEATKALEWWHNRSVELAEARTR